MHYYILTKMLKTGAFGIAKIFITEVSLYIEKNRICKA